jgi:hypothetical protein
MLVKIVRRFVTGMIAWRHSADEFKGTCVGLAIIHRSIHLRAERG